MPMAGNIPDRLHGVTRNMLARARPGTARLASMNAETASPSASEFASARAARFDLVIRDARVATAADVFDCDIGITDGVITALGRPVGERLGPGRRELAAEG